MKYSINLNDWQIWEQNASPMYLTMTLNAGMQPLRDFFGMPLWTSVIVFEEKQGRWLFRPAELKQLGQKMIDYLMCPPYRVNFETGYENMEKQVRQKAYDIQFSLDISKLTNNDLVSMFESFCAIYYEWYKYGWFCEPIQFRGQDILTAYFEKEVKIKYPKIELTDAQQAIYTIEETTFTVEILQHLAKCAKNLAKVLKDSSLRNKINELRNDPEFASQITEFVFSLFKSNQGLAFVELKNVLDEHSNKYYWKQNNYFSTKFISPKDTLKEILSQENFNVDNPAAEYEKEIIRIRDNKATLLSKKSTILEILPSFYQNLAALLSSVGGILLDKRKRTIMIANSAFDHILDALAERTKTDISECRMLIPQELRSFVSSPKEYKGRFLERLEQFLVVQGDFPLNDELISDVIRNDIKPTLDFKNLVMNDPFIAEGSQVEKALKQLNARLNLFTDSTLLESNELQGVTTYYDPAEPSIIGIVTVIKDPKHETINKDDILVATSTTPDYMEAIRHCKAIITDWGGQTSHAAITSRELKKPCIIGTNFASQILKNGDKIRMNLDKGVIEVIR